MVCTYCVVISFFIVVCAGQPEQPRRLEPLRTCTRPIRVGLSKRAKTKHLHRPHPYKWTPQRQSRWCARVLMKLFLVSMFNDWNVLFGKLFTVFYSFLCMVLVPEHFSRLFNHKMPRHIYTFTCMGSHSLSCSSWGVSALPKDTLSVRVDERKPDSCPHLPYFGFKNISPMFISLSVFIYLFIYLLLSNSD